VLVALTLSLTSEMTLNDVRRAIRDLTAALKQADERIEYVYVRPAPDSESGLQLSSPAEGTPAENYRPAAQ
jgi:hypothetical protein